MALPPAFFNTPLLQGDGKEAKNLLLYIHVPFCKRKCNYCAFHSQGFNQVTFAWYLKTLLTEIELWGKRLKKPKIGTIFFGGGTPSLIPPFQLELIMDTLRKNFTFTKGMEVTLEANPDSANDLSYFQALFSMGINRLSLGFQSLDDRNLETLGRPHSARQATEAYYLARKAGFGNISIDLIWGLPRQKPKEWNNELKAVVKLKPEHISCYGLTIEPDSVFGQREKEMDLELPPDSEQARMFIYGAEFLEAMGYIQYEISNFARMGFISRHNQGYWDRFDYLGLGPSAVSTIGNRRFTNPLFMDEYDAAVRGGFLGEDFEELTDKIKTQELIMLSLRTSKGLNLSDYKGLTGKELTKEKSQLISALHQNGLIRMSNGFLRLTKNGMLVSNSILQSLAFD
ncbi:radical SAM family heme chaperone HemW [Maridesulfovibrio hydrothermalis]|uniref:Heme chaperone HemW n=1 Tax=Maridesulfovibrio hydrothermalis AM13 = DSM 14728 TaxID=1121451 RepID=L0RBC5_9BACT|nr:radical SAM family heme chaperone HemW [Maridesulfovibrio hydrothermalis]CCO22871.1 Oxygen-independent coproporphyrinogen III oxidase [Maridesulfovibrio hydrothermalis AM13 = DSM 14728]